MSSDFWARKIGGLATPQSQVPSPPPQPQGAWWHEPQPQQPYGYNPSLQAQMPGQSAQFQQADGTVINQQIVQQLMRVPADQLNQEQMELIAEYELASKPKYNQSCPQCGSANFAPVGTKIGTHRLGSDKCFECGGSSSTFVSSPEPALGGRASSSAPYRDVRQIDTGGANGQSMYMQFRGVPQAYVPRA